MNPDTYLTGPIETGTVGQFDRDPQFLAVVIVEQDSRKGGWINTIEDIGDKSQVLLMS